MMLVFAALFLAGVASTAFAVWMLFKRRLLVASVNGSVGISLLSISIIIALIALNMHTFSQLTKETQLAVVRFGQLSEKGIPATLELNDRQEQFILNSKEWQLDARFQKFKSWAYLFGTDPVVRLESFRERHPLGNANPGNLNLLIHYPKLAELGSTLSDWIGLIDTYYGSSVYMPVKEGSVYSVSASISGLVARAENEQASTAVTQWMRQ